MSPYLSNWYYVPCDLVGHSRAEALKSLCTIKPRYVEPPAPEPIRLYDESVPGYLGLPVDWGLQQLPFEVEDLTIKGSELVARRLPDPNHERASPGQEKFMRNLLEAMQQDFAVLALASTGSGKTVAGLDVAAKLGRSTLILVHLERLGKQWVEEIKDKLGIPEKEIGWVQQGRCEYDKSIAVAMMPSLVSRRYPEEFYRAWGTVIWDEVDVVATKHLLPTLGMFPAMHKLALTATWRRRDNTEEVYFKYFGRGQVLSESEVMPVTVRVINYRAIKPVWGNTFNARVKCLSLDYQRNQLIAGKIAGMYKKGRVVLAIGHTIKHLKQLMKLTEDYGVPSRDMGQYTRVWESGGKRIPKEKLDEISNESRIIFATYGMLRRAVNIPRLDAGIDVTPVAEAVQVVGRIRRPLPGKPMPLWYTIKDSACIPLVRLFEKRLKDYKSIYAEICYESES